MPADSLKWFVDRAEPERAEIRRATAALRKNMADRLADAHLHRVLFGCDTEFYRDESRPVDEMMQWRCLAGPVCPQILNLPPIHRDYANHAA